MVTKMLQIYVLNCYSDQIRVGKFFFLLVKIRTHEFRKSTTHRYNYFTQNWFQEHYMIIVNSTSKNKSLFLKRDFK